ncbi:imidazolonepropionase [Cryomorphaceae bacterium 1068]|nr:imidazolonepropionase [Cryomorphaceae bacterium 1068]
MKILIKNIKGLVGHYEEAPAFLRGHQMDELPVLENAFLAIEDGKIGMYGKMEDWGGITDWRDLEVVDAEGRFVLPSFCDSHAHLVFAASRELEFEDRIKGLTYEEVAARGGGILNSSRKLREISEDELFERAMVRLKKAQLSGTSAIEIKSGYGLDTESELKMLRVIRRLREESGMMIKSTFLGAHALPPEFKDNREGYVDLIIKEMIPEIAKQGLADYADVFCEKGYFTTAETLAIVEAASQRGMKSKIHVNQFNAFGAIPELVKAGVVSVDHLEVLGRGDTAALANSNTIATALPLCSLFLSIPYTPVRELIDNNAIVALATDFNPGSAPSSNMAMAVSLGCIKMKMTPAEAINAATINGAAAMEISDTHGTITQGKSANVMITEPCEHLSYLAYSFGEPAIDGVILEGEILKNFD